MPQNPHYTALGNLITAFRGLQVKDSVSPDTLGALLQQMADLSEANSDRLDLYAATTEQLRRQLKTYKPMIECHAEGGELSVRGHEIYEAAGYVPYIFRNIRKRNRFGLSPLTEEEIRAHGHCHGRKGWSVFGSSGAVKIIEGTLLFADVPHISLTYADIADSEFSYKAETLVETNTVSPDRMKHKVAWGRSCINMYNARGKARTLRLPFGLAYGPVQLSPTQRLRLSDMASPLAEFSVRLDSVNMVWVYGK